MPVPVEDGFHEGARWVQRRAGQGEQASRLAGMLTAPVLDGGKGRFLPAPRSLRSPPVALTARCGPHNRSVDPVSRGARERGWSCLPIHWTGTRSGHSRSDDMWASCSSTSAQDDACASTVVRYGSSRARSRSMSIKPSATARGTSGRGEPPGFVRVERGQLWWPDYPGNNLFHSMGNIVEDPSTALLFMDFRTRTSLQLSGRSVIEWVPLGGRGDDGCTGRRVRFTPERIRSAVPIPPA